MTNNQCEGYGLLALSNVLSNGNISQQAKKCLLKEFSKEIRYLFDIKSPEEAEDQGLLLS